MAIKSVAPWSYSGAKVFDTCPKKFYHEKILCEFPFKDSTATLYGKAVHEAAELYVGKSVPIPKQYEYIEPTLNALIRKGGTRYCELKMGLTDDFYACDFFGSDVWVRGVVDLLIVNGEVAFVVDYKTGKSARYADTGQLELMALMTFAKFPEVKEIRAGLIFLVADEFVKDTYTREREEDLQSKWLNKYRIMQVAEQNDVWNPNPNGLCKAWCPVLECSHNGKS